MNENIFWASVLCVCGVVLLVKYAPAWLIAGIAGGVLVGLGTLK